MKKSRFTDSQIMAALKRVEVGLPVPEICRELGISTATFYKWRAKFGGMDTSMITRMKELEDENRRLRKMYLEEKLKAEIDNEYLAPLARFVRPDNTQTIHAQTVDFQAGNFDHAGHLGGSPTRSLESKKALTNQGFRRLFGVADGTRTHDDQNHNLGLYQLSYSHQRLKETRKPTSA